jgi:DNA-binding transcriptional ArsR family regulator
MSKKTVTPEIASDLANLFEALSDTTRIRIIATLMEGEIDVGELIVPLRIPGIWVCGPFICFGK